MKAFETEETGSTTGTDRPVNGSRNQAAASRALRTLSGLINSAIAGRPDLSRRTVAIAAGAIFLLALSVRLLHWQDAYAVTSQGWETMSDIERGYKREAGRMLSEGGLLYPNRPVDPGDARLILHPPGYSILMAATAAMPGGSDSTMRLVQIIFDALSAVMVFLIAAELLHVGVAAIAATLVSVSPHLAYHALWFSPDTMPVLPILVSVYLIVKASKRPRITTIIAAGAMVGLSLWLRANALLLAPFLAAAIMLLIKKGKRVSYGAAFVGATLLVVSPITIRNWVLYRHFIPISIAGGENLVVGIADYDQEGRFGMPVSDGDAAVKDVEWYNREDYGASAWFPDGVERDQARYARGLEVIRSNPSWFLGVMIDRAFFMLRYNDAPRDYYPFNTSIVPIVAAQPPVTRSPASAAGVQPAWSAFAEDLLAGGSLMSEQAAVSLDEENRTLRITGDGSSYGDQFASAPIAVKPNTDYVLAVRLTTRGAVAAKVTSNDRRIALASEIIEEKTGRRAKKKKTEINETDDTAPEARMGEIKMAFASGDRSQVLLVISNNGATAARPVAEIAQAQLFDLGATSYRWTRYPRAIVRGLQKNLYKTRVMLPLVIVGVLLLGVAGQGRALVALLAVPAYYLSVQSALCTEYRYILAIHYFLFIMAGVSFYCFGKLITRGARWAVKRRGDRAARRRGDVNEKVSG